MTEQDINQQNKKIAEFLGELQVYESKEELEAVPIGKLGIWCYTHQLKYHTSWEWLMPVVEKIESVGYDTGICSVVIRGERLSEILISPSDNKPKDGKIEIHERSSDSKIQSTYNAVIQFINWYNQQNKQQ